MRSLICLPFLSSLNFWGYYHAVLPMGIPLNSMPLLQKNNLYPVFPLGDGFQTEQRTEDSSVISAHEVSEDPNVKQLSCRQGYSQNKRPFNLWSGQDLFCNCWITCSLVKLLVLSRNLKPESLAYAAYCSVRKGNTFKHMYLGVHNSSHACFLQYCAWEALIALCGGCQVTCVFCSLQCGSDRKNEKIRE